MIRLAGVVVAYGLFAAAVGWLSSAPHYRLLPDDKALVTVSFSHAAERREVCRRLSQEELQELPPNMRRPEDCPRARHDTVLSLRIDGNERFRARASPSGLWSDGKSVFYHRVPVDAGRREIAVGMSDSGRTDGFDFESQITLDVEPGRNVVIGFDPQAGHFVIE